MPEAAAIVPSFLGSFVYGVDAGRRVMCPSAWRPKNRAMTFMAVTWPIGVENRLLVLPPDQWQTFVGKIMTSKFTDERAALLQRTVAATSAPLTLDKAWRFTLPESLAAAVGITKEAQFVGCLQQFEIWSPQRYQSAEPVNKAEAQKIAVEREL